MLDSGIPTSQQVQSPAARTDEHELGVDSALVAGVIATVSRQVPSVHGPGP